MNKSFVSFLEKLHFFIAEIAYITNWKLNPFSVFNCQITLKIQIR